MLQVETVLRRFDVWEKGLTFTSLQPYVSLECRRPSHEDCWRIQPAGFITAATDTAIGSGTNSRTEKNSKLSQSSVPRLFFSQRCQIEGICLQFLLLFLAWGGKGTAFLFFNFNVLTVLTSSNYWRYNGLDDTSDNSLTPRTQICLSILAVCLQVSQLWVL